ncbi:MAG: BMP family ABC transporter substrate-binding protein [Methanoregulaceae archaeon]
MNRTRYLIILAAAAIVILLAAFGQGILKNQAERGPVVYMVYNNEKGDLSYTDSAYRGLFLAQEKMTFRKEEFVFKSNDLNTEVTKRLGDSITTNQPGLVILESYSFENLTSRLAKENPKTRFVGIDQDGPGRDNLRIVEITSYGSSYLAGQLAASATKTGHVGIILGTQSWLLDAFRDGFQDGCNRVNPKVTVDVAYVSNTTAGFSDPSGAAAIARSMYTKGDDIIYTAAGYSGAGVIGEAKLVSGRYVIGVDTDQTYLGPTVVMASAVKNVDQVVYMEIEDYLNGTFTGGKTRVGLADNATGLVFNPAFDSWRPVAEAAGSEAVAREEAYERTRESSSS